MQSQYTKYFLHEFIQKFKQSMNNIYVRMLEDNSCIGKCKPSMNDLLTDIDFVFFKF